MVRTVRILAVGALALLLVAVGVACGDGGDEASPTATPSVAATGTKENRPPRPGSQTPGTAEATRAARPTLPPGTVQPTIPALPTPIPEGKGPTPPASATVDRMPVVCDKPPCTMPLRISWQDSSNDEEGFKIYAQVKRECTGPWLSTVVATVEKNVTRYEGRDPVGTNACEFRFGVSAFGASGESAVTWAVIAY